MALIGKVLKGIGAGSFLGGPIGALAGGVLGLAGAALSKKHKKPPAAQLGAVTRDDAAALVAQEDELRRRKGGAADILNGVTGTEAALSGGKLVLGN